MKTILEEVRPNLDGKGCPVIFHVISTCFHSSLDISLEKRININVTCTVSPLQGSIHMVKFSARAENKANLRGRKKELAFFCPIDSQNEMFAKVFSETDKDNGERKENSRR
jgi:hypothetical protein